jgi:hypothetical protein
MLLQKIIFFKVKYTRRLTNLSIISIKHQICESIDTKSLIAKFAAVKLSFFFA